MVDVFRAEEYIPMIVNEAIKKGATVIISSKKLKYKNSIVISDKKKRREESFLTNKYQASNIYIYIYIL